MYGPRPPRLCVFLRVEVPREGGCCGLDWEGDIVVPHSVERRLDMDRALPVHVDVVVAEDGEHARQGAPLLDGVDLAPGGQADHQVHKISPDQREGSSCHGRGSRRHGTSK